MNKKEEYFNHLKQRSFLGFLYDKLFLYPKLCKSLRGLTLDVGCGIGDMLSFRSKTIGVDINQYNIDFCQRRNLDAILITPETIRFDDNTFDSVLLDNVLEHIQSPDLLIQEIRRVLKPGGTFLVGVPGIEGYKCDVDHKVYYDEFILRSLIS